MKTILKVFIVLVLGTLGFGLTLPTSYRVEREIDITAHPIKIFVQLGELKNWPTWNPWQKDVPGFEASYGETTSGVGGSQTFKSKFGTGEVLLTRTSPGLGIKYDFRFNDTWNAKAKIETQPMETYTLVRWIIEGEVDKPVVGGYIAMMMDEMIGGKMAYGLKDLKEVVDADEREIVQ